MSLLTLLGVITALGYSSIDEYCNDKGRDICDVVDDPDYEDYCDEDEDC